MFQDGKLLAEREVLEDESSTAEKGDADDVDQLAEGEHGPIVGAESALAERAESGTIVRVRAK